MEKELIEQKLAAFSVKTLQEVLTVQIVLEREGISLKELGEHLGRLRGKVKFLRSERRKEREKLEEEARKRQVEWIEKTDKCPQCNTPLTLRRVSAPKGVGNKFGYRSHWFCTNEDCTYEKYTKEIVEDIYDKVMRR